MTTQQPDLYHLLDCERDSSQEQIKRSFRKLAMEFHPDRNRDEGAEDRFKEINAAYEVLSDPEKRQRYDRFGMAGVNGNGPQGFADAQGFGGFGDIFDAFFRGTAARRAGPQRGGDLRARLSIDFEDAVFGTEQTISFERTESCADCRASGQAGGGGLDTCRECGGSGEVRRVQQSLFGQFVNVAVCNACRGEGSVITDPCPSCRGRGLKRSKVKRTVKIPAGVDDASQIRITGEGDAGARGGPSGNLYIDLTVKPHKQFKRVDADLVYELPLNIAQAALGTKVEIPTLRGDPVGLELKTGTQHGEIHVIRGQGVPHLRGTGRGDLLVRTHVVTPKRLSKQQREALESLAGSLGTPDIPDESGSFFDRLRDAFA